MDYFISIDNNFYYNWQTNLLIESFRHLQLENKLLVCFHTNPESYLTTEERVVKNFLVHKRFYNFKNINENNSINKFYSLLYCIKNKLLKQPFLMLLEPDLVINQPLNLPSTEFIDFFYLKDLDFSFEKIQPIFLLLWKSLNMDLKEIKEIKENWIYLGDMFAFNNFPEIFFDQLIGISNLFFKIKQGSILNNQELKIILITTLFKIKSKIRFTSSNFIVPALSTNQSAFISYRNGIPPYFHKSMFNKKDRYFSMGDPLEILSNVYNCPNTKYISDLAKKILN